MPFGLPGRYAAVCRHYVLHLPGSPLIHKLRLIGIGPLRIAARTNAGAQHSWAPFRQFVQMAQRVHSVLQN